MNFITWNKAYSLYPKATFLATDAGVNVRKAFTKYNRRGWKMAPGTGAGRVTSEFLPHRRQVGDMFTWKVPLCTRGVDSKFTYSGLPVDMDYFDGNTFDLMFPTSFQHNPTRYALQY